jgi:short-subunit dehydrogenase
MGKTALVTGASESIGKEFVEQLAKQGYAVTAVAQDESALASLTRALGPEHRHIVADLSTAAGQTAVADALRDEPYDVLVNNAGVGIFGEFTAIPLERTLAMVRLNCEAVVALAHAFLSGARPGDALINVSSALAFMPLANVATYCATKSFVTALSETLWYEQKQRGVYVLGLCPWLTATGFEANIMAWLSGRSPTLSQSPEQAVRLALRELDRRQRPTLVAGVQSALLTALVRALPRGPLVSLMARTTKAVPGTTAS